MMRSIAILTLLTLGAFNAHAATVLPQTESNGEDGAYTLISNATLFNDLDNIYNFTDFSIANGTTLNIFSDAAIFIYSTQSITINGLIYADTPELNFIAPEILITGTLDISDNLGLFANNITFSTDDIISSGTSPSSGIISSGTLTGGTTIINGIEPVIIDTTPITGGSISLTPVPLPAALWLMITGLLSFGLIQRRHVI